MNAQPQPLLQILDDFAPKELFDEACKLQSAQGWSFGNASNEESETRFWKMDLEGIGVFDSIWNHARSRCEELAGETLTVARQYANGQTYGLGGRPHTNGNRPGSFTLLYYPMAEWREQWEGETVFYGDDGEIAMSVGPRPNRAVLFDSRISHAEKAPGRTCVALRVTVAYQLLAARLEAPAATAVEAAEEGIVRTYTAAFSGDEIKRLLNERLEKLGETVRLPGFRPGKIPRKILEERYGASTRSQLLTQLATDAAASRPPQGSVVVNVEGSEGGDGVEFRILTVFPPALPDPDLSSAEFVRLTASNDQLAAHGLTQQDLDEHLQQQLLDHVNELYDFPAPRSIVEKEFEAIWKAAQAEGVTGEEEAADIRRLAERRVRLGVVIAELGRRYQTTETPLEPRVVERMLSQARIQTRPATAEELEQLA